MIIHSLEWKDNKLYLLDQTRLPGTYVYLEYSDYLKVADAIKNLVVRGAPVSYTHLTLPTKLEV